jgi:hypothetical protein
MMKFELDKRNVVIIALCVVVLLLLVPGSPLLQLVPGASPSPGTNEEGFSFVSTESETTDSNVFDSLAPTSMTCTVIPNPISYKGIAEATITSGGHNYGLTFYIKHLGADIQQEVDSTLGSDGKFITRQQANTCGHWQIWAVADNDVSSNVVDVTVTGINIVSSDDELDNDEPFAIFIYTHFKSATVTVFANDPSSSSSKFLGSVVTNSGGFAQLVIPDSGIFSMGSWELDCNINGQSASDYGGTYWIEVV